VFLSPTPSVISIFLSGDLFPVHAQIIGRAGRWGQVFQIDASVTASIAGLTITGGSVTGGGVYNADSLALTDCALSGNSAQYGGGLCNFTYATAGATGPPESLATGQFKFPAVVPARDICQR